VLTRTTHLAKASSVAIAAGFCPYAARLTEWIGVKGVWLSIKQNLPGKGEDMHKVLSIAFPEVFYEVFSRSNVKIDQLSNKIRGSVDSAIGYLSKLGVIKQELPRNEVEEFMKRAILGLLIAEKHLEFDLNKAKVFTEMQMISYGFNLWGVPDVIIEDQKSRRAIVIEWKTGSPEVRERDKVQVYSYALLEFERLGHITPEHTLDTILKEAVTTDPKQTKVYPMIVRPRIQTTNYYYYSDYPALPQGTRKTTNELTEEVRERIKKILLSSYFISILVSGLSLAGIDYEEVRKTCNIYVPSNNEKRVGGLAFNFIPLRLRRFAPANCVLMQRGTCPWADFCELYFVNLEHSEIDAEMWKFRYRTIAKHLRDLASYKALYELSYRFGLDKLVDNINRGYGFRVIINMRNSIINTSTSKDDIIVDTIAKPAELEVKGTTERGECTLFNGRIDIFEFDLDESNEYDEDVLILRRKFRRFECTDLGASIRSLFEIASSERKPRTIRLRKPVQIFVIEPHVNQLTLMHNIFARIDDVKYDYDKEEVTLLVRPISWALKLPFLLFKKWLRTFSSESRYTALVVEANADLTHIELEALGALHTIMKRIAKELITGNDESMRSIIKAIKSNRHRVLHLLTGLIPLWYRKGKRH
jgi:hypothetical protein